ncbi:MAG: glycoside hydrolase family 130 protein [Acidimicrobiales bacterium]
MNEWELGPFTRRPGVILGPREELRFHCPVLDEPLAWAAKDVFNPGAVVRDGKVCLLVRAEDRVGRYAGTSRIGLATSADGLNFALEPEPVIYPDRDDWQAWEWPGGCEDPRVVETPDGDFVCLYTAFDGSRSSLFSAASPDLRHWEKRGPAFAGSPLATRWSKSGSIVTEVRDGRLVAARIQERFWMYWGEGTCFVAASDDLIRWSPIEYDSDPDRYLVHDPDRRGSPWSVHRVPGPRVARPVLSPRPGRFDSLLVEPGPPAVLDGAGIHLIYNGANHPARGAAGLAPFAYRPGQALMDGLEPGSCIARSTAPFLDVEDEGERTGQVGDVVFAQGLVLFEGRWRLYLGLADSRIGCAEAPGPGAGLNSGAAETARG